VPIDIGTASDSTYHARHERRTLARAECIAGHIDEPGTLLDVGCNNGITSRYMLDRGKSLHVTGIELEASTVEPDLIQRDNFRLLEGNVTDLDLEGSFDHIIYGAVHHHILNLYGLSAAIRTLQKLVAHCDKHLFFETGQLGEGGRWEWQTPMRRNFRTDEEHFFYILRSIEHLISGFEVIGTFWIHGIRRHYLRIDVRKGAVAAPAGERIAWPKSVAGPYVRSRGRHDQKIHKAEAPAETDSPSHFWIADCEDAPLFIKKHAHMPIAAEAEWSLGMQVDENWAVRPVARVGADDTLAFPYLRDAIPLSDLRAAPKVERRRLAAQIAEIFRDARQLEVIVPAKVLFSSRSTASLADVVDINPNNLLVVRDNGNNDIRVVDFEIHGIHTASRNRIHFAHALWLLKERRAYAALQFVLGWAGIVAGLISYQFTPFARRVTDRQPSLSSLIVCDFRTFAGKTLRAVLRPIGIR
jgi:SAM-dependent methyltransferase